MERQARHDPAWGEHVYVKIPITNTRHDSAIPLIGRLAQAGVKLNVTAVMTLAQVRDVCQALAGGPPAVVSVFAGRIADTGRDPVPLMAAARELTRMTPERRAALGEPARAAQHLPGGRDRLRHHHRHQRHPQEAGPGRQGPRLFLARHREDVPRRRGEGGVHAVIRFSLLARSDRDVPIAGANRIE